MKRPRHPPTKETKQFIFEREGGCCFHCGIPVVFPGWTWPMQPHKPNDATIDHIIPWSKGGGNTRDNLLLSCRECNENRGNEELQL